MGRALKSEERLHLGESIAWGGGFGFTVVKVIHHLGMGTKILNVEIEDGENVADETLEHMGWKKF